MARPRDADSARTWDTIVGATEELLRASDAGTPSLREVAERADVSLGTIQYYFGDKETLLEACLDGYHARVAEVAGSLLVRATTATDSRAFVEACVRELSACVQRDRWQLRLRAKTNADLGNVSPQRRAVFQGQLLDAACVALEPHVEVGPLELRLAIHGMGMLVTRIERVRAPWGPMGTTPPGCSTCGRGPPRPRSARQSRGWSGWSSR